MQQPRPRLPRPVGAQVGMMHQYPTTRRASLFHPVSAVRRHRLGTPDRAADWVDGWTST